MGRTRKDWIDGEQKPKPSKWFELCMLDLGEEMIPGWWTGHAWTGLRYEGQKVNRWKFFEAVIHE